MDSLTLLKELTMAPGPPGFEHEVRAVLRRYMASLGRCETDNMGSLITVREGSSTTPRVMLAAHMDEIGFMVTAITKEGFLTFVPLGGWWEHVLLGQRVTVHTANGEVTGVIGSKPPHSLTDEERKKVMEAKDLYIDIGACDENEAKAWVQPGDPVIPVSQFTVMRNGKIVMAKALDDRAGCSLLVEVLTALKDQSHPNTIFATGTVQEEVGLRGAYTACHSVEPHVAIALDVSIAADTPGDSGSEPKEKLGEGPSIILYDASLVPNARLRDYVIAVAKRHAIPFQFGAIRKGGTDGGRIHLHGRGVPTLVICLPTRYIHSHNSVMHLDDYMNTVKLLTEIIKGLDEQTVATFTA